MGSRRQFLQRLGAVSGSGGAYLALRALGLVTDGAAQAATPLAPGVGEGTRVVILGAGLAGLAAAYELGRAGYDCTVLEARERTGGRNWTIRRGSTVELNDGGRQVCDFEDGHYFNAGPARIPSHHQATLGWCRELGVEMEVLVNSARGARIQAADLNGGRPVEMRQAIYDTRGRMAELLGKAVRKGALDEELTGVDKERLVSMLRDWGGLSEDHFYKGSVSAGWATAPGAGGVRGKGRDPLTMATLLHPAMGFSGFEDIIDMQATMLQPVGGMDRIPAAFEARLGAVVQKGCEVRHIGRRGDGVSVRYRDKASGAERVAEADYAICTLPLSVLKSIPGDFAADRRAVFQRAVYDDAIKVAFQSPRFWEEEGVYGGLSFTDRDTFMTWYPSGGFHKPTGVLIGAYCFNEDAASLGARSLAGQVDYVKASVEALHPGQSRKLGSAVAVHWAKVPYSLGIACEMGDTDEAGYTLLSEPDGPVHFAGEHLAHVGAWQQGAFLSARRVVGQIEQRRRAATA